MFGTARGIAKSKIIKHEKRQGRDQCTCFAVLVLIYFRYAVSVSFKNGTKINLYLLKCYVTVREMKKTK